MKALRFDHFGDFSALEYRDVPDPTPGSDEVVVEIYAASINPSDTKNIQGRMVGTTLPRTPGRDFAGVVVAGPKNLLGQDVWGSGGDIGFTRDGTHAEKIMVPIAGVRPKPRNLTMAEAASAGVSFIAAYLGLVKVAGVNATDIVVVIGAGGAVGSAVVQIAKWRGARVIAIDRHVQANDSPAATLSDLILNKETDDLVQRVMTFTKGAGASVVYDCVGGPLFEPGLTMLGQLGRQVSITSAGMRRVSFDLLDFYRRRLTLYGVDTRALTTVPTADILEQLLDGFEAGVLRPPAVAATYSLNEARAAYAEVDAGSTKGKVVLLPRRNQDSQNPLIPS